MGKIVLPSQERMAITKLWGHDPVCSCHSQAAGPCQEKEIRRSNTSPKSFLPLQQDLCYKAHKA